MLEIIPSTNSTAAMERCQSLSKNSHYSSKRLQQKTSQTERRLFRLRLHPVRIQVVRLVACPKLCRVVVTAKLEMFKSSLAQMLLHRYPKHKLPAHQTAILNGTLCPSSRTPMHATRCQALLRRISPTCLTHWKMLAAMPLSQAPNAQKCFD